ncbi:MAG: hypothetical protein A2161_06545 [Candidatus Schekmanbacteria bacterium RBG_13_48_7]|uniref:Response regulatory domain-containing protein n=1 Tax=Candidatus Schekmanbacteria bacterium RBG_13_48_7 TaxID=1817878 RepID=A0A1F7RR59_9BACT|nr:MAG: hypothetical protein A2161_06545 [Candidatus Schekmanbacteria bacterium RBG_13_48_7]
MKSARISNNKEKGNLKKLRILLIDDEEIMLDTMYEILMLENKFEVDRSPDARDAIQKIKNDEYQLIISDLRMPGISGYDLFNWIINNKPQMACKVLFTSGDPFDPRSKRFFEEIPNLCLVKPFGISEFMDYIHRSLGAME